MLKPAAALNPTLPVSILANQVLRVQRVQLRYRGPSQAVYFCWGLQSDRAFNNGDGLFDRQFASVRVLLPDAKDLTQPFFIDFDAPLDLSTFVTERPAVGQRFGTWKWFAKSPSAQATEFILFGDGAGLAPDPDANVYVVIDPSSVVVIDNAVAEDATPARGQPVRATIYWHNAGGAPVQPTFRLDIQRLGGTPLEGVPQQSPVFVPSGASGSFLLEGQAIPGDWNDGDTLSVRIVIVDQPGVEFAIPFGVIFVSNPQADWVDVRFLDPFPVQAAPGDVIRAHVYWWNVGTAPYAPIFRLDIQKTGLTDSWLEGVAVQFPPLNPSAPRTDTVTGIAIPSTWKHGERVDVKVQVLGASGFNAATQLSPASVTVWVPIVDFSAFLGGSFTLGAEAFARSRGADSWSLGWFTGGVWRWFRGAIGSGSLVVVQRVDRRAPFHILLHIYDPVLGEERTELYPIWGPAGPAELDPGGQLWINNIPDGAFMVVTP